MTNEQLVKALGRSGHPKATIQDILSHLPDVIREGLRADGKVVLTGVGILKLRETKARVGRNPKTGEEHQIAAGVKVKLTSSSTLLTALKA
jgi:nucleoid DNA-binding protein